VPSARPASVPLSKAVTDAIVDQYTGAGGRDRDVLPLVTARPALREAFLAAAADIEDPLAAALAGRLGEHGADTAEVLSASVAAAVRIALRRWVRPAADSGLIVVSGSLPDLIRTALAPLAPALDGAGTRLPLGR